MHKGEVTNKVHTVKPLHCCLGRRRILVRQSGITLRLASLLVCVDVHSRKASALVYLEVKMVYLNKAVKDNAIDK